VRRARIAWRVARLLLLVFLYVPLHYLWRLVGRRSPWPSRFLGAAARACGVRLTIEGAPLRRDVFVVSNHSSWLDILILGGATGAAFVAKAELERAPVVGWLCTFNRTIFVKREDRRAMPAQIAAIRDAMADGPVAIFPEGTTSDGTELLPFKGSLLQVLDPAPPGVRLQPLFLDYGPAAAEIAWGQEDGRANAVKLLGRPGRIAVTLHCLAPLDPGALGDRKAIAAAAYRAVAAAIRAAGSPMRTAAA
jgi:lyso-ornithine lipid O-acyltransferase